MAGDGEYAQKRMDAIKLAKASKWDELKKLVDTEPLTAQQVDSYGMLPLHWACTEPHSISESVLMSLLKAFPHGARSVNTAEMLPLQIAIKAQAKIEWLQALLASYPDAVLKKAPSGEHAVQLARKSNLPARSVKLLDEMFHHVCDKAGYAAEQFGYDEAPAPAATSQQQQQQQYQQHHADVDRIAPPQHVLRGSGGYSTSSRSGTSASLSSRRMGSGGPDGFKARALSDNDFQLMSSESVRTTDSYRSTTGSSLGGHGGSQRSMAPSQSSQQQPSPQQQSQYQSSARLSNRAVVSLPPRWTIAPSCYICSHKFGPFHKKRHHCRNCGQSICSDHSARERMRLPHYGLNDRHRVCTVCHDVLRNASRASHAQQLQQPATQSRFAPAHVAPARRSDEAAPRLPESLAAPHQLERHVSAPARANMDAAPYQGIHDQVASLQKQVSLLMEEKELAESQLRAQAELLGDAAFDPERLTNPSRRESRSRLNSYPLKPAGSSVTAEVPTLLSGGYGQMYGSYESSRGMPRTNSSSSFTRGREVDIDRCSDVPTAQATQAQTASTRSQTLEDEFAHLTVAVDSNYDAHSDASGERPTEGFGDLHDDDDDADSEPPEEFVGTGAMGINGVDVTVIDDDDDDDDDYGTLPEIDVMVNLGLSMMERGLASAAVQAFVRAVDMCPHDATLHSYLGRAYYADENLDDAVVAISRSLELEPSATNSTLLGKILFEKGDHEKAIAAYQQSLAIQEAKTE